MMTHHVDGDQFFFLIDGIDQAILVVDAAGVASAPFVAQGFGFAYSLIGSFLHVGNQGTNSLE